MGAAAPTRSLDRNDLFAGLCVVGFVNGNLARVIDQFRDHSRVSVIVNAFDISVLVWVALFVGVALLRRGPKVQLSPLDAGLAVGSAAAFLVPVAPLSWMAVSALTLRILGSSEPGSFAHRGSWILLAMTIPMFWSRVVFWVLSDEILAFDAILVAWIQGAERAGNAIAFSDGSGYLWIAPGCSSIANISLTVLCWILATQLHYRQKARMDAFWPVAACAAVIVINVTRLCLLQRFSQAFDLIHGPVGAAVTSWLSLASIVGFCALGVRHDLTIKRRGIARDPARLEPSPQDSR